MLRSFLWRAPAPLADHVRSIWRIAGSTSMTDWLLPDIGGVELALHLGEPGWTLQGGRWARLHARHVVGGLGRASRLRHGEREDTIGIALAPGCACLLGVPAAALRDVLLPLGEVTPSLDRDLARWAEARAEAQPDSPELLDRLIAVLAAHLRPRCDGAVTHAARALALGTDASLEKLAASAGLSRRQLTRRFGAATGISARKFARIARFARAWRAAAVAPPENWAALAADAGYYDQPHLLHDFQVLVGSPPTRVFPPEWYAGVRVCGGSICTPPPCRLRTIRSPAG